jgi:hypothetical protein
VVGAPTDLTTGKSLRKIAYRKVVKTPILEKNNQQPGNKDRSPLTSSTGAIVLAGLFCDSEQCSEFVALINRIFCDFICKFSNSYLLTNYNTITSDAIIAVIL